ncbi:DUF3299 domain-containing protein [Paraglaciecola aquimarina]|uniref:DUF3299 domain-containing protein n=1 Tax=Paraglaciecola algarum TaxID=3050085 RepID=A0ABS9D3K0_9ALTE|nr:DUF3299 domain-containing protein [Paraglaciecola sp. G1-23]MCF2947504.1 DUF3299 domain-containing protein [Paraglaciecola sp. G1-23]
MNKQLSRGIKIILSMLLCLALGITTSHLAINYGSTIKQQILPKATLYSTSNDKLKSAFKHTKVEPLNWADLLPQSEQKVITKYQAPLSQTPAQAQNLENMTAQIMRSIQASSDQDYQQALISTNTVEQLENKMVSISGFIVPIDFYADKSVQNLFLVPYFGACLHFPPPPPNQILFVQLDPGFSQFDITQAYTLKGKINRELFEDPMGTSAYTLEPVFISKFNGQPDDFRKH